MKKSIILTLIAVATVFTSNAQSVAINTDNSTPDASAILDIKSTDKGLLIPRITQAERNDMATLAQGLLIFNTSSNSFQYYDGLNWVNIAHSGLITGTANKIPRFTGPWGLAPGLMTDNLTGVSINSTNAVADASALFDMTSTDKGILVPRMTMAQRDAIATPAAALLIYQTDFTPGFYYYTGSSWSAIFNSLTGWSTSGNTGTNPANNFLGTKDNQPLVFKLNNFPAGKWDQITANYFIGSGSGQSNTTGTYNVGLGNSTLNFNTSGNNNTAIGGYALFSNTTGYQNTATGLWALKSNTTGSDNTATGMNALKTNITGSDNTATGNYALENNNSGSQNVAVGKEALKSSSTANDNTAIGYQALYANTTGFNNVAVGNSASYSNTDGQDNAAFGKQAMFLNTWGDYNCAFGNASLNHNTIGRENVAIGYSTLSSNANGQGNTALGNYVLNSNISGSYNTAIGFNSDVASSGLLNTTAIGWAASVSQSNSMVFGNNDVTKWGFGVNPGAAQALQVGTSPTNGNGAYLSKGGVWTNVSDRIKKENFTSINGNELLEKIASMPITRWKYKGGDEYHIGPMAQDFYALFGLGEDDKSISTIDPAGIALAGIQELKKENDDLKKLCNDLLIRIEKLEHK